MAESVLIEIHRAKMTKCMAWLPADSFSIFIKETEWKKNFTSCQRSAHKTKQGQTRSCHQCLSLSSLKHSNSSLYLLLFFKCRSCYGIKIACVTFLLYFLKINYEHGNKQGLSTHPWDQLRRLPQGQAWKGHHFSPLSVCPPLSCLLLPSLERTETVWSTSRLGSGTPSGPQMAT